VRYLQLARYVDEVARVGSIRKAAEQLAITSSALNRRILAMEDDLGTPIFERTAQGVRLSVAGELFIHHVRRELSDMERVRSQIADLTGERRGHVSIVCGQAVLADFLPGLIERYRQEHPGVSFSARIIGRREAATHLSNFSADIAIAFEPERLPEFQVVAEVQQRVHLRCSKHHPLVAQLLQKSSQRAVRRQKTQQVRLSDCIGWPVALPTERNGLRHLLERQSAQLGFTLKPTIESDSINFLERCLNDERTIGFQIPIGFSNLQSTERVNLQIDERDVPAGRLVLGHLKGRTLSVAAARFMDRVHIALISACGDF